MRHGYPAWIPTSLYEEDKSLGQMTARELTAALAIITFACLSAPVMAPYWAARETSIWTWPIVLPFALLSGGMLVFMGTVAFGALSLLVLGRLLLGLVRTPRTPKALMAGLE